MGHGIVEQHQQHLSLDFIVLLQLIGEHSVQVGPVSRQVVLLVPIVDRDEAVEQARVVEVVLAAFVELVSDDFGDRLCLILPEPLLVVGVNHSVLEDSLPLMAPELDQGHCVFLVEREPRVTQHAALDDFGQLPQVELIMELLGGRGELGVFQELVEDEDGGVNDLVAELLGVRFEPLEVALQDFGVDLLDEVLSRGEHGEGGEVPLESGVHAERTGFLVHGPEEQQVLDVLLLL